MTSIVCSKAISLEKMSDMIEASPQSKALSMAGLSVSFIDSQNIIIQGPDLEALLITTSTE